MTDSEGGDRSGLVVELTDALDATDGAWEGWNAVDDPTRELYATWVAQARRAGLRRDRALTTAHHAAQGILRHAVQRFDAAESAGEVVGAVAEGLAGKLVRILANLIN
ncbi:YdeI/OmpD-associated family protein [Frankia sp. Mgl5]|uniref:YdeI/OmpD-associated family protein n=1 Tax=Frankia sp. Mgl5 TaxID=2933793 RepID=UPI0020109998|nr:YdeI/OmpD-associated family protein [Frankia sp. Mgl5]MCK9932692.1 YdeI/OmpD-associated family protein [Frankia sp. Mgl5]